MLSTDFSALGDYATTAGIDPNGKLVVAGVSRAADGTEGFAVARYNLNQTRGVKKLIRASRGLLPMVRPKQASDSLATNDGPVAGLSVGSVGNGIKLPIP